MIRHRKFRGETPKLEPELLGPDSAQLAQDCRFESGALSPTDAGLEVGTMVSNPVKGLYTENGLEFYAWPVEAQAFQSPVIDDAFNRVYYLLPSEGIVKVTSRLGMAANGPTPVDGVRAGVPNPVVAPVLTVRNRGTLPDYPSVTISAESWWTDMGTGAVSDRAAASVVPVTLLRLYNISRPAISGATPANRRMAAKLTFTDDTTGKEIFSITARSGEIGKSQAVPGTVEGLLQDNGSIASMYLTWGVMETRSYVYAAENTWNEIGAPSPPALVSITYIQDVQIDVTALSFTGFRPLLKWHIFRTYGSVAQYIDTEAVQDGAVATRFYDGTSKPSSTGLPLESVDYLPSPIGLEGMEQVVNGWFVAFKGKMLYMTEAYQPHAWPYSKSFPTAIRGVRATQSAVVVTCAGGVYLLVGALPQQTQPRDIGLPQPGIAQRSMVNLDGAVAYASNDGIAMVAGNMGSMEVSQKLFDRKTWRARFGDILLDASMRFAYFDGHLVATSNTQAKGFIVRMDDDVGTFTRTALRIDCTFELAVTDTLYYSVANKVYKFQAGAPNTFDWWGRDWVFPDYASPGIGHIRCAGPITVTLYAEKVQVYQVTTSEGYFRMPTLNAALKWSVRLQGAHKVSEFSIATSMLELKRG